MGHKRKRKQKVRYSQSKNTVNSTQSEQSFKSISSGQGIKITPSPESGFRADEIEQQVQHTSTTRLTTTMSVLVITILGFATHFTGLRNPFVTEDYSQIINNPVVHSITNIGRFFGGSTFYVGGHGATHLVGIYYRPLMTTTFSILYTLFGPH